MKLKLNGSTLTILFSSLHCFVFTSSAAVLNNQTTTKDAQVQVQDDKPILLVVSYDGFRNEYLRRNVTPNMLKFRNEGVWTDKMLNVFPTKTFTNHYSIATGFYPNVHGVLANSLYDNIDGNLNYSYKLFHYNQSIQPIWVVNEKANGTSGCMMWPGSDFEYENTSCTYTLKYDKNVPLMDRVDTIIKWITDPIKPANLIMFYSEQPDKLAHVVGPDSQNITDVVASLDLITKYIQEQLIAHKLEHRTNVIHLSDHGMAGVPPSKFINLTDHLDKGTYEMYGTSPVLQVVPAEGKLDYVYESLKNFSLSNGNFDVYKSEDLPTRWHATNQQRFGPIIAVAKMNYGFQDLWSYIKKGDEGTSFGVHGYDNKDELMYPIFMAKGPAFKTGGQHVKPFETVDLFNLFTNILGITNVTARDGSAERINHIRAAELVTSSSYTTTIIIVVVCILVLLGVTSYMVMIKKRKHSYNPTPTSDYSSESDDDAGWKLAQEEYRNTM